MVSPGELSERKAAILRALVQQFIRTGEPVGSEAVAASSGVGVSSATIRNELSSLEELGYLAQPHTSAGRVPTDLAYRFFVNALPARSRLRDTERLAIVHFFDQALADVDEILRGTTHLLSRLTRYASLALAPTAREAAIARSELIRIGSSVLLLVVFDNGMVDKRMLEMPAGAPDEVIDEVSRVLADATRGKTLGTAGTAVSGPGLALSPDGQTLFARAAEALGSIEGAAAAEHLFLSGVSNIAAEQAFHHRETLRKVYEALERESEVLRVLREAAVNERVSVTIGRENPMPEMWEASVVAAPYAAGGRAVGMIGVVGPIRMDYAAAISAVRAVADRLSAVVEALSS